MDRNGKKLLLDFRPGAGDVEEEQNLYSMVMYA